MLLVTILAVFFFLIGTINFDDLQAPSSGGKFKVRYADLEIAPGANMLHAGASLRTNFHNIRA